MPIDIEITESKRNERLRIRHNTKYVKSMPTQTPDHSVTTSMIRTDPHVVPTVSLDLIYSINKKEKGIAHIVLDQGQLGMHIERLPSSKKVMFFPSGLAHNANEAAERLGAIDVKLELDDILNIMKIIEPRLISLSSVTQGNSSMVYGDIGLREKIPIPYMGEGIAKLLSYILAIANAKNGIVLIDEIENGLHHSVLPDVWKSIETISRKYNCQVILTTHSYEAIKAMVAGLKTQGKNRWFYIRMDRENNAVVPKYYSPDVLQSTIDRDWEIR